MNQQTPEPGLPGQRGARTGLRVAGLVLTPLGALLAGYGLYRFVTGGTAGAGFGETGDNGTLTGLLMFAAGGFLLVIGFGLLNAGYLRTTARYAAGETMPVVKDAASYLTAAKACGSCGRRNDAEARFCDGCGHSLG